VGTSATKLCSFEVRVILHVPNTFEGQRVSSFISEKLDSYFQGFFACWQAHMHEEEAESADSSQFLSVNLERSCVVVREGESLHQVMIRGTVVVIGEDVSGHYECDKGLLTRVLSSAAYCLVLEMKNQLN